MLTTSSWVMDPNGICQVRGICRAHGIHPQYKELFFFLWYIYICIIHTRDHKIEVAKTWGQFSQQEKHATEISSGTDIT